VNAVQAAELGFRFGAADEDALTGGLGQSLATVVPRIIRTQQGEFTWSTQYFKTRGRGVGAPEAEFGMDGIVEIEIRSRDGAVLRTKGLPFQAKKRWTGRQGRLIHQCQRMLRFSTSALVIDYSEVGYMACSATAAVEFDGNRRAVERGGQMQGLADVLGDAFLECRIGMVGLHYDPVRELVVGGLLAEGAAVSSVITTEVRIR
jgi:hypothetical protein